jgi:hypothetical protein
MALSDACSDFLTKVQKAASQLSAEAQFYSGPPFSYGPEVDAIEALGQRAAADPLDAGAMADIVALSSAVQQYYDTTPGDPAAATLKAKMLSLSKAP